MLRSAVSPRFKSLLFCFVSYFVRDVFCKISTLSIDFLSTFLSWEDNFHIDENYHLNLKILKKFVFTPECHGIL